VRHLALIEQADRTVLNGKSVQRRAAGQFYTHPLIGRALARQVAERVPSGAKRVSVIDPFAGDGRLVCWLIEVLASMGVEHVETSLWDQDAEAVEVAREAVRLAGAAAGVSTDVEAWAGDTFNRAASERRRWSAVVTNPPWELIKPDRREMEMLPEDLRDGYVTELKALDRRLATDFPTSQPSRRFAGWGTNLSRVGTEVALRLTADQGVCGVVCPSSLLADSTTVALRRWLLEDFALTDATHYPAEARLFEGVDMPCCTIVTMRGAKQNGMRLSRMAADHSVADTASIVLSDSWLRQRDYSIPVEFGVKGMKLLRELDQHPRFARLEMPTQDGLWAGRELDETNRASFTIGAGSHPFVRSRHVHRLQPVEPPSEFLDTSRRAVPASVRYTRLAWRDIARPSQLRRIHASILPPGPVSGNSVSVAYFRDRSLQRTLALLAVVSSLPFEFQVRSLLMTHHLSLSVMRAARTPIFVPSLVEKLAKAAARCLAGDLGASAKLEVTAARAYGLSHTSWSSIASHFGLSEQERASLDSAWRRAR
jgi:Alw26I/Eco31I/Esp3I family type II restriction m6 adenine DNA methyltransferase